MRFWQAVVTISVFAACAGDSSSVVPDPVIATSSRTQYALGQQVVISIRNNSNTDLFVDGCYGDLEHYESNSWRVISGRGCFDWQTAWRRLAPGVTMYDSIATARVYPAGKYRTTFIVHTDSIYSSEMIMVHSNTFVIK